MKIKIILLIFITLLLTACQNKTTTQILEEETWSQLLWDGQNYKIETVQEKPEPKKQQIEWQADINYDNKNENIILENNILKVYKDNRVIWQTNADWQVENVIIDDLNQDKKIEINFSVEKIRGRYRKNKELKESDEKVNCFYIYQWKENQIKPTWLSSPLDKAIDKAIAFDINQDNKKELIVLENVEAIHESPQYISIWSWNGWGFSNDFQSDKDNFKDILEINNKVYIKKS